ncbi:hypothetical protein [Brachybacterium nesterenkovii]|uniref:Uncharacterized protein n=1 Tax=Brachybacterium nesterenkovii TaxID=47847 RepID=A0A1X6X2H8_9MICO|nr:hypothetical protein [Brachybacterium nesterenkovii]SLM91935.1 hypothetical protein FM110_07240 [Brachybacterium nesterenkovii]
MPAPDDPAVPEALPALDASPVPATAVGRWIGRRRRLLEAVAIGALGTVVLDRRDVRT